MGYVIAAYGVTAIALVGYALHLHRERSRLHHERSSRPAPGSDGAADRPPNTG